MGKDDQAPQHTGTQSDQYSESLNYLKKSLTLQYVQQQIQSSAKAPQGSGGQSGTSGSSQSGSTSGKQ